MTRRAALLIIGTAAVWGASYMFIKVALDDLSEGAIVFLRCFIGGAALLALAGRLGQLEALRGRMRWVIVIAVVQVVIPFTLITYGENHVSSSLTAILVAAVPIFTALLALRFDHAERVRGWGLVGILVGMGGVALLFGVDLSGHSDELLGGLMIVVAALSYAIAWMLVKHKLAGTPAIALSASTISVAAVLTVPLIAVEPPTAAPALDTTASMIALGLGGTGLAFVLYNMLITEIGPGRASVVGYVAPGFSLVYGAVLLGEAITVGAVAGLALILAGSWLAVQGRLPWQPDRRPVSRSEPSRSTSPAPARAR